MWTNLEEEITLRKSPRTHDATMAVDDSVVLDEREYQIFDED